MFDLTGKKIVIIGGTSGIGLSIAKACRAHGAKLIIASRNLDKIAHTQHELGKDVETQQLDYPIPKKLKPSFKKLANLIIWSLPALQYPGGPSAP